MHRRARTLAAVFLLPTLAAACRSRDAAPPGATVLTEANGASTISANGVTITTDTNGNGRVTTARGTSDVTNDSMVTTTAPGPGGKITSVLVGGNGAHHTFACDSTVVSVTGNDNTLAITGRCEMVNVLGNDNRLTVAAVHIIQAGGSNNTIRYAAGVGGSDATVSNYGTKNTVVRVAQ